MDKTKFYRYHVIVTILLLYLLCCVCEHFSSNCFTRPVVHWFFKHMWSNNCKTITRFVLLVWFTQDCKIREVCWKRSKHLCNARYHNRASLWFVLGFFYSKWHTEVANAIHPPSSISCCLIHKYTTVSSDWFWLDTRHSVTADMEFKSTGTCNFMYHTASKMMVTWMEA